MSNELIYNNIPSSGLVLQIDLDGSADARVWTSGVSTNVSWVNSSRGYTSEVGSFNGSTSYITIPTTWLPTWNNDISVNCWVNTDTITWYKSPWLLWGNTIPDVWKWLLISTDWGNNDWTLSIWKVYWDILQSVWAISIWERAMITVTHDWTTIKLYINWVFDNSVTDTLNITYWVNEIWRAGSTFWQNWDWKIWLHKIYNTALTQQEIHNLYIEWQRLFWDRPAYPSLLQWTVWYWDFKSSSLHNLVNWVLATNGGTNSATDHLWRSWDARNFENEYMSMTATDTNSTTWSMTIELWIKQDSTPTENKHIFDKWGSSLQFLIRSIDTDSDKLQCLFRQNNNTSTVAEASVALVNWEWTHIVCTYEDSTSNKFYINWVDVTDWSSTHPTLPLRSDTTQQAYLCKDSTTSANYFDWDISVVKVINRALSASEVSNLYTLTSKNYIYEWSKWSTLNLQDWLVMSLDWDWNDVSGNGNDWTPSNVTKTRINQSSGWDYNGSSSYMTIPDATDFDQDFSISTWINTDLLDWVTHYIWNSFASRNCVLILDWWNTDLIFQFYDWASVHKVIIDYSLLSTWAWYYITATRSKTAWMEIFLNWVSIDTDAFTWNWEALALSSRLWSHPTVWLYYNWKIFNLKVRNRVLTEAEINQERYLTYITN